MPAYEKTYLTGLEACEVAKPTALGVARLTASEVAEPADWSAP